MSRKAIALIGALILALVVIPGAAAQTPSGPDYDIPGGHFYTQANGGAGAQYGYRIYDDASAKFWTEFQRLGGVAALGYPASRRFQMDGFFVQATQKVILQWRPEVSQAYFVNVFDKLHDLNQDPALQSQFGIPAQLPTSFDAGKTPDQVQSSRIALLDADGAIKSFYNSNANAILYYGLPTSNVTPQGPFGMLRAQRIAIQHWNQDNPAAGIKKGDVTVVNGGDVAKKLGLVTADAQVTETSSGQPGPGGATPTPTGPTPTPLPAATPTLVATGNFPWMSKLVNTPPTNCGAAPNVPCIDSGPNTGIQYVKGHIMDKSGNVVSGITVEASFYGNHVFQSSGADGTWSFEIADNCPLQTRVYDFFIVDAQGHQSSDIKEITYTNCASAGEFHFDFVKTS